MSEDYRSLQWISVEDPEMNLIKNANEYNIYFDYTCDERLLCTKVTK